MKKCRVCGVEKHLSEFYHYRYGKDGYRSECKGCHKENVAKWQRERREQRNEYQRDWKRRNPDKARQWDRKNAERKRVTSKTWREANKEKVKLHRQTYLEKHPDRHNVSTEEWRKRNPTAAWAHGKLGYAVKKGDVTRPDRCEGCGVIRHVHAHHDDYSKPLEVKWLCPKCHATTRKMDFFAQKLRTSVGEEVRESCPGR